MFIGDSDDVSTGDGNGDDTVVVDSEVDDVLLVMKMVIRLVKVSDGKDMICDGFCEVELGSYNGYSKDNMNLSD